MPRSPAQGQTCSYYQNTGIYARCKEINYGNYVNYHDLNTIIRALFHSVQQQAAAAVFQPEQHGKHRCTAPGSCFISINVFKFQVADHDKVALLHAHLFELVIYARALEHAVHILARFIVIHID